MRKQYAILVAGLLLAGCGNDAPINGNPKDNGDACKCSGAQVCVNGACVDEASPCAKCDADEVCVNDACVDADSPCAKCDKTQVCVNNSCVDAASPCAKCGEGQVCVNDACVDAASPCAKCGEGQVCVNATCYDRGDPCAKCGEGQVCNKGACYDAADPCAKCSEAEVCDDGACRVPSDPCEACAPTDSCVEGKCVPCATSVCGSKCCFEGEVCDVTGTFCTFACDDGRPMCDSECCAADMFCSEAGYCDRKCEFGASCGNDRVCCGADQQCYQDSYCAPACDSPRVLCGDARKEVCCEEGQVCLNNECHKDCAAGTIRCGADQNLCCDGASQICIFNKCLPKGASCEKNEDCELWEFCDVEGSKTCVSQDENDAQCIYRPPFAEFKPKIKWHYSEYQVENTPAVGDITGDGMPEVVFTNMRFELIALDGDTGKILAKSTARQWNSYDGMALADVDNDGKVEVIATTATPTSSGDSTGLAVLNLVKDGDTYKWVEKAFVNVDKSALGTAGNRYWVDIHPAIADIDSDTIPEIVTTQGIIKGNKLNEFQCRLPKFQQYYSWYQFGFVIADLDQDGQSEIIAHKMFDNKCNLIMDETEKDWGFSAVADLIPDQGGEGELVPEIVRVKSLSTNVNTGGFVSVWKVYKNGSTWTQKKMWETKHPGGGGGHPNIADFDGDKKAEIGIAGGSKYAVFKGDTGAIIWSTPTNDSSSYRTGSSVFDFEGDGKAEVVYRDQCYLRVYSGVDGKVLMEEPCTSGTVIDYPLIVDVDADGKTEIITTSSPYDCGGFKNKPLGVIAYEDSFSRWVRTRKIWNQHTYHVTNINEDGSVPVKEPANWLNKRLNNYRANTQPDDMFNAPNLKAGDLKAEKACPNYKLTATIRNEGSLSARNVWVSFYIRGYDTGNGKADLLLGSVRAEGTVAPGGSLDVPFTWNLSGKNVATGEEIAKVKLPEHVSFSVDDAPGQNTADFFNECIEDDNDSQATELEACPIDVN
ncbi:MAG: hypothetical protein IJ165_05795 [Proteobacteria bacterium]|nr:hypothetical protein [Pseudomonadota bacterium]